MNTEFNSSTAVVNTYCINNLKKDDLCRQWLHKELCVFLCALAAPLFLLRAQVKVKQPPDEGCGWRRDLGGDSTPLVFG